MKAFAIDELGQPGSVREIPVPEPGQAEVRIRVAAAGLNPFDSSVVQGRLKDMMEHRFPLVPGMDASGTIEAVGEGTDGWSVGDEVFGSVGKMYLGGGTLAELATMSAGSVARKPASIEHTTAAAVPVAGVTALTMVDAIAVADGHIVVAIGATGGVGSYLVQLAERRGAHVAAVCSAGNAAYARSLGAAEVFDYAAGDVVEAVRARYPDGIDAVADMHGDREVVAALAEQVRAGGHVTSAVGAADAETLGTRGIEATNARGIVTTAALDALVAMLERGEIASPQLRRFPLADAAQAIETVGSGHVRGKIVVLPT
jgi:NADPH:quinone reductase-like Zn-dependent oxidoreductase